MSLFTSDDFLDALSKLLSDSRADQPELSVTLSQTRAPADENAAQSAVVFAARLADEPDNRPGGTEFLQTRVAADAIDTFLTRYNEVCRARLSAGLKKRDRKRQQKRAS